MKSASDPESGPLLNRPPLREQIREIVRTWLIDGTLSPGSDLNERELAEELGASRTPVREALLLLALEGFVSVSPYRGYFVAPLTRDEAHALYTLIGVLERHALLSGGLPEPEQRRRMEELDEERRGCMDDPGRQIELDRAWHAALLSGSATDAVLHEELDRVKNRVTRYEQAFQRAPDETTQAMSEHRGIREAIAAEDLEEAAARLQGHWNSAVRTLPRWLPENEES
jgi:DNA-binding GntR family transcriptional regulator